MVIFFLALLVLWVVLMPRSTRSNRADLIKKHTEEVSWDLKLAEAKYRARQDRKDRFKKLYSYRGSHTPWDEIGRRCVTCGFSLLDIDIHRWYCSGEMGKKGLTETQAFMLSDQDTEDYINRTYK